MNIPKMCISIKKEKFKYIRAFISFFLFFLILYFLDWVKIVGILSQANKHWIIISFSLHIVGIILSVFRWNVLLQSVKIYKKFKELVIIYWISSFYNIFLPSSIGGDVVRIYDLTKDTGKVESSIASVVIDRLIGMIILLLIALFAVIIGFPFIKGTSIKGLVILFLLSFILLFLFLTSRKTLTFIDYVFPKKIGASLKNILQSTIEKFSLYRRDAQAVFIASFWSVLIQADVIIYFYLVGRALNIKLDLLPYCILIPLIQVITLLPISISGIGVREGAFIAFFNQFHINAESAFALSVLGFLLGVISNSIGGIFLLLPKKSK